MDRGSALDRAHRVEQQPVRTPATDSPVTARGLLLVHLSLLLVALSWGSNFSSIKYLLRSLDAIEILVLRLTGASLCFAVVLLFVGRGFPRFARADWPRIVLMAVLGITINTGTVAFGAQFIPAAVGSLVTSFNPVFTAVLSRAMGGEPLTNRKIIGIAIAFTGFLIVLIYGGPEAQFSVQNTKGIFITLCGPLAWAFYTVMSKPLLVRYEPVQFAGAVTIIGTLPLLPLFLVKPGALTKVAQFGPTQWLAATMTVVFAMVVSYALWYRGLRILAPTQIAVYIYLVPVFGTLVAWALLGERITIYLLLGGLTILLGVIVTNTSRRGPIDRNGPSRRVALGSTIRAHGRGKRNR